MALVELPRELQLDCCMPDDIKAIDPTTSYNTTSPSAPLSPRQSVILSTKSTSETTVNVDQVESTQQTEDSNEEESQDDNDDMVSVQSSRSDMHVGGNLSLAPTLPAKSALRASRLLASLPRKLSEDRPMLPHAAPHEVYLSSEEDASSSADDFSDFESDSESDGQKSPQLRSSHEDTARMVSYIFAGKPSLIQLAPRSASSSPKARRPLPGLSRISTEPTLNRVRSGSSTSSTLQRGPVRSSSMVPPGGFDTKSRPQFLNIDPFATKPETEDDSARGSKASGGLFKRTFSLVRKRSKPLLNQVAAATQSRDNVTALPTPVEQTEEPASYQTEAPKLSPSYQDIMRAARKNSAASSTSSPVDKVSPLSQTVRPRGGLTLSRRRSAIWS